MYGSGIPYRGSIHVPMRLRERHGYRWKGLVESFQSVPLSTRDDVRTAFYEEERNAYNTILIRVPFRQFLSEFHECRFIRKLLSRASKRAYVHFDTPYGCPCMIGFCCDRPKNSETQGDIMTSFMQW
jgi:hypothetical protein